MNDAFILQKLAISKEKTQITKLSEILSINSKTIDTIDGTYQGQCAFDKPHGNGSMIYNKTSSYSQFDGYWIEGNFYDGTLIYKNGDSFKG